MIGSTIIWCSVALCIAAGVFADDEVTIDPFVTSETPSRNLNEEEIRNLPAGVTFGDVKKRLRYFTGCEIAVPLTSFEIHGGGGRSCMMGFSGAEEYLVFAVLEPPKGVSTDDGIVLWPKEFADKKFSELAAHLDAQEKKRQKGEPGATDNPDDAQ